MATSNFACPSADIPAAFQHCQPGDHALVTGASAGVHHLGREVTVLRRATVAECMAAAWSIHWIIRAKGGESFICADSALTPLMPADGDVLCCRLPQQPLHSMAAVSTLIPT